MVLCSQSLPDTDTGNNDNQEYNNTRPEGFSYLAGEAGSLLTPVI